jgi:hypothetical protein
LEWVIWKAEWAIDIRVGESGVWEWGSEKPEMHQWMVEYFEGRREDGAE